MKEFLVGLLGEIWGTLAMSFVPLIELKGGIIFARGVGMGFFESLGIAYVGSTLAFFLIFFLLRPILALLKKIKWIGGFADNVEGYFKDKADETLKAQLEKNKKNKMSESFLKKLGVFIFVAIPLPMTGVWTGTAIAVFLNLKFKETVLPVMLGNLVAGLIISLLAALCIAIWPMETAVKVLDIILYALFAIALVLLGVFIYKVLKKKKAQSNDAVANECESGENK